jgi:hypothetical protein
VAFLSGLVALYLTGRLPCYLTEVIPSLAVVPHLLIGIGHSMACTVVHHSDATPSYTHMCSAQLMTHTHSTKQHASWHPHQQTTSASALHLNTPCTISPRLSYAPAAMPDTANAGTVRFADNACANLDALLPQEIVGQELALAQLSDALCHHLSQPRPKKPLVISVHGPPGVGKTYTHLWLARILYSKAPSAALQCPGMHCKGYKVRGKGGVKQGVRDSRGGRTCPKARVRQLKCIGCLVSDSVLIQSMQGVTSTVFACLPSCAAHFLLSLPGGVRAGLPAA